MHQGGPGWAPPRYRRALRLRTGLLCRATRRWRVREQREVLNESRFARLVQKPIVPSTPFEVDIVAGFSRVRHSD